LVYIWRPLLRWPIRRNDQHCNHCYDGDFLRLGAGRRRPLPTYMGSLSLGYSRADSDVQSWNGMQLSAVYQAGRRLFPCTCCKMQVPNGPLSCFPSRPTWLDHMRSYAW
jgi:hypothetical protein